MANQLHEHYGDVLRYRGLMEQYTNAMKRLGGISEYYAAYDIGSRLVT